MSLDIHQIAEAFCSYRFVQTYPYMADEIKWNIVGEEELGVERRSSIDATNRRNSLRLSLPPLQRQSWTFTGRRGLSSWKALPNFKIRKIKPQAWPAVMSFNFRMGGLLRLHPTSLS